MGKTNLKVYMKRNYPERYKKYFAKDMKKGGKKKPTVKRPKESDVFEGVFKNPSKNSFGFKL